MGLIQELKNEVSKGQLASLLMQIGIGGWILWILHRDVFSLAIFYTKDLARITPEVTAMFTILNSMILTLLLFIYLMSNLASVANTVGHWIDRILEGGE